MIRSTIVERNEQILSSNTEAQTTWHNTNRHSYNTTGANSFARGANGIVGVHLNMRVVANSDTLVGQRKIRPIILQCSHWKMAAIQDGDQKKHFVATPSRLK